MCCTETPEGYDGQVGPDGTPESRKGAPGALEGGLHGRDPMAAMAALAALSAAAFAYVTTESLPVGLLQPISHALHSSLVATGRLVTVYAAIIVVLSAPLAHLAKGLPRKATICFLMAALVLTSLAAAAAPGYGWLMAVRVVTALGQALFWSLVIPTAASLFPAEMTGRAVGWIPRRRVHGGRPRCPRGHMAWAIGRLARSLHRSCGAGGRLVSSDSAFPAQLPPCRDPCRDWLGARPAALPPRSATTALAVTGFFCVYTYVSPFLTKVAGLALRDVAGVLLITGSAIVAGVLAGSVLSRRRPDIALIVPVAALAPALIGLYLAGRVLPAAIAFAAVVCFLLGVYDVTNQNYVLVVAPASTDISSAWTSASFNVGIAGGSLVGGLVLDGYGPRATALVGALVAVAALLGGRCSNSPAAWQPAATRAARLHYLRVSKAR